MNLDCSTKKTGPDFQRSRFRIPENLQRPQSPDPLKP
jgi:hypothetical protein